ncbi:T9SS type A sorting domain-containing protein [Flammeovirga sp. MY04]|uniref:T9SS type A sorting domain-containing protein n=1 Tax=Flammeovirga sp. MY04 TaxID=1191459 RepID=UPI0008063FC9|nr:T9SS type A sorting domain-containing protein [Flammeovirga sp. MY04]ANQ48416.1 T9SS type A sorting domain-containing protein [Flammeovirga sp. MY04]
MKSFYLSIILTLLIHSTYANIHFSSDQIIKTPTKFTDADGIYIDAGVTLTLSSDVVFNGNVTLLNGAKLIIENGAKVTINGNINLNNSILEIKEKSILDVISGQLNLQGDGGSPDQVIVDNSALIVKEIHAQNLGGHEITLKNNSVLLVEDFIQYNQELDTDTTDGAIVVGGNVQGPNVNLDFGDACGNLDGSVACDEYERSSAELSNVSQLIEKAREELLKGTDLDTVVDYIQSGGEFDDGYDLPVELLYFKGFAKENTIDLHWATATETNSDYFVIYRSFDNKHWTKVDEIEAAGHSITKITYYNQQALEEEIQYYRLHQIDFNGTEHILGKVMIQKKEDKLSNVQLITYQNNINLFFLNINLTKEVVVYDVNGRYVLSETTIGSEMTISNLRYNKVYILRIRSGSQVTVRKVSILQ